MIYKYKGKIFSISGDLQISPTEIHEFNEILYNSFKKIKSTEEVRVIILETWMLIEYYIRSALSNAFDITKYSTNDLDPKYDLLPNSFQVCLDKLKLLLDTQRKLPLPNPEKDSLSGKLSLVSYIKINYSEFFNQLVHITEEYNKINHPESYQTDYSHTIYTQSLDYYGPYQQVDFVKSHENIDAKWFNNAKKINKARNMAAHSYDSNKIYAVLGINGSNRFENSREYCLTLIQEMCNLKICDSDTKIDIDMDT